MKKVLIIGYGDIGRRVAVSLPNQEFIGVSRSAPSNLANVIFIQQDWINQSSLTLPSSDFSTIVLILKPTSSDMGGYKQGFLDASYKIMDFFNKHIRGLFYIIVIYSFALRYFMKGIYKKSD